MREGVLRQMNLGAAGLYNLVVLGSLAGNDKVTGNIREKHDCVVQFLVVGLGLGEELGRLVLQGGDFPLHLLGLFPLAFPHQASDLSGEFLLA